MSTRFEDGHYQKPLDRPEPEDRMAGPRGCLRGVVIGFLIWLVVVIAVCGWWK